MKKAMFERDILYPTQKQFEPGSIHVAVYPPESSGSIPIIVEAKTAHNPLDYIPDIIGILQSEVFDRIKIDIKKCGLLFFKSGKFSPYYLVKCTGEDNYSMVEVEKIDSLI